MFTLFLIIFLSTIFLCLCTYVFYPTVIWVLGKLFPFKVRKGDITPTVSIIISAYNEAKNIERKIENTLAVDYPKDKMEILVGSDGSTDETATIVKKFADRGVRLINFKENRGKTAVQNDLVERSNGDILLFTDAASFLAPDAVNEIVKNFADERVGCVAGQMRFVNTEANLTTRSQGLYWTYELKIRELESKLGSLIGVDGPLYSVRRDCYVPLKNNIISDLVLPLLVLKQGKSVILEPGAIVDEHSTINPNQEFATRRRVVLRGLVGLSAYFNLLNPLRRPLLAFQICLHKLLRWFVGPLVLVNILACIALSAHWFFKVVLVLYLLLFLGAALGWVAQRLGFKPGMLTLPYYFTLVNSAATMGIIDFFRKKQATTWQPVRH